MAAWSEHQDDLDRFYDRIQDFIPDEETTLEEAEALRDEYFDPRPE